MMYFKRVKSYKDLKEQYRKLLKGNHPDNGGDVEIMKEINVEFDSLFKVWKDREEAATGATVNETADGVKSKFYTAFGWEGSRHDWNRSLKDVAKIVRTYVKEKYPTYKFSVRTHYASMCQELLVDLKESPIPVYKEAEELTEEDRNEFFRKANRNNEWSLNCWDRDRFNAEYRRITAKSDFYKVLNEATKTVIDDVDSFVNSYNFEDCDGSIDYFHVDFYYFGCAQNNGMHIKVVPKTARIKKATTSPAKKSAKEEPKKDAPEQIGSGYTYKIIKGEDTRDGSELWIVRIVESLDRSAYIAENKAMKERGGYYSKFKHGFLFRFDPSEILKA